MACVVFQATWFSDGTCDDGVVGNFYCEGLHWDGGDCLTEDVSQLRVNL